MSKRLKLDVEMVVSDDVTPDRAAEVLEAMLVDLEQDSNYHEVLVIDNVTAKDEATLKLVDVLDNLSGDEVDKAIDAVERLENDDE